MPPRYSWFEVMGVHQDYFWFTALTGWSLALVMWWRHPARGLTWAWVPWTAGAVVAMALAQFAIFNPPSLALHTRIFPAPTQPGVFTTVRPIIEPTLLADLVAGLAQAVAVAGWLWLAVERTGRRGWRWAAVAAGAGLAALHHRFPGWTALGVALGQLVALRLLWRLPGATRLVRAALMMAALIAFFSPVGGVAVLTNDSLRDGEPTTAGHAAAMFQTAAAVVALAGLLRGTLRVADGGVLRALWREERGFLAVALGGLAAGVGGATYLGAEARRNVLQDHLRGAEQRAYQIQTAAFGPLAEGRLRLENITPPGEEPGRADAPLLAGAIGDTLVRELDRRGRPPPFTQRHGFVFVVDGWLAHYPAPEYRPGSGRIELMRRATPEDEAAWREKRSVIEEWPQVELGRPLMLRWPVLDREGRMLAWFEHGREETVGMLSRRGRTIPLLVTAMGFVVAGTLLLQRRATRERQAAEREAAVEAEANRLKTTFLAKVSHELRTPIQSLLGYSELLQRQVTGDARAEAWLNALRQHGELMTRLVNDLIDLSAVEAGTFRLRCRPLALAELARQTIESLRPRAEARGLALHATIAPDLPPWLEADGERLRQVMLNLVGNAVKFTDEGSVNVELAQKERVGDQAVLALIVTDTGPGIPPAEQHRLFNAFSRLEFTAHKDGSGLGLSLAAALCRAMGGDLTLASDGVKGSCFTATFRAKLVTASAAAEVTTTTVGLGGRHILVVDDNALVRELFIASLTDFGARCGAAATAAEALAAVESHRPDVIVLDLALPDDDGTRLAPRLRRANPNVRIVGVSAHAGPTEREQALAAGMNAFLAKPVALDELAAAVAGNAAPRATPESPGLRRRLEDQFRAELPAKQAELRAAIAGGDWRRARAAAHYLANSAAVVRDSPMLEACVALARAAEAGDGPAVQAAWPECAARLGAWMPLPLHADTSR